jgi:protein-disulfide isomerase
MPPKQRPNRVPMPRQSRRPSNTVVLVLIAAVVIVTTGAIVLSLTVGSSKKAATESPAGPAPTIAAGSLGLVNGIEQHGLVLGNPKAKVTLTEYIDTSCPVCRSYFLTTSPTVARRYVRTGKVKIEARMMAFVGPSSTRGRQLLLAAARQNKAWQFAELVYNNQGDETTAWLTDSVARAMAAKILGLSIGKLFSDASSTAIQAQATKEDAQAKADGVNGTPTFVLTAKNGKRYLLGSGNPGVAPFVKALNHALAG